MAPIAWNAIGKAALGLLQVTWPLLLAGGIALFVANNFYFSPKIDALEMEIITLTYERDAARDTVEQQNASILELANTAEEVTKGLIGDLRNALDNMTEENRRVIQSIVDAGVPEGCEDSRQFLIDMIDQLQWEDINDE